MLCSVRTWLSSPAVVFDAAMFACDEARRYRCASVSSVSGSRRSVGHPPICAATWQRRKRPHAESRRSCGGCSGPSIRPSAGARRETLRWRLAPLPTHLCKQRANLNARANVRGGDVSKPTIVQDLRRRLYKREHKPAIARGGNRESDIEERNSTVTAVSTNDQLRPHDVTSERCFHLRYALRA